LSMNKKRLQVPLTGRDKKKSVSSVLEEILEKKLEDISTLLCSAGNKKSSVYEDVIYMVERSLFKIALKRCNHVKSSSAAYLGINRNTFQKKMAKLDLDEENDR
jgi:DNA-binding protein Fis